MASVLYQQIPDQHSINADDLMIFYKIYDHQEIRSVFKDVFECELEDFFQHIFILYCMFKDPIFITWPQKFDGLKINQKLISKIFQKISMPIEDHREFSRANRLSGPDSKFRISSFVGKPIVVIDIARPEIWCPFVGHFIRRLTYGIYYDLIKNSTFANYIGYAFERHVGRTIELFALDHWRVYPEAVSGKKKPKSSVDWLMVDDDVALFIECKFKRPMLESKTDPSDESATLADLKKYASFCAQSIIAAEREHSGMFERELPDDASYIMIVTPEDWLILNGAIGVRVREMCVEELECRGASSHLIEKYSIINVGCKSFGWFLQAAAYFGLSEVLRAHSSERHLNDFTPAFVMNNYVGREGFQPTDAWGQEFNAIMDMSALQIKPER